MIDFRYHLVSIIAVFLALAIGIVVGSTALQPSVLSGLDKTLTAEKAKIDSLYGQNRQLQQQINADQAFASAAEQRLLSGLLTGQHVVLVEAPGAPSAVTSGVMRALTTAGATVATQLQIQPKFLDPSPASRTALAALNQQLTPPGVTLRSGTAQAQAGQIIATAILAQDGPGQPAASSGSPDVSVLKAYASGGFLTASPLPSARATLAVVLIPGSPPSAGDANPSSQNLVTLAQQLSLADDATVLAGQASGSGPGSAIAVLRASSTPGRVSSVDDADLVTGQIVVAQALYQQLAGGRTGSYGTGSGATGTGPSPAPSPSASLSTTPAASIKRSAASAASVSGSSG